MPAITLPPFTDTEVLGYDRMQQLYTAINDLANPPQAIYDRPVTDPTLNVTSTAFVAMDDTAGKFNLTITTKGNPVLLGFNGTFVHNAAGAYGYLDVELDGSLMVGAGTLGLALHQHAATADYWSFNYQRLIVGLAAGSHTFKMRWRTSAGTWSLLPNNKVQFFVREV